MRKNLQKGVIFIDKSLWACLPDFEYQIIVNIKLEAKDESHVTDVVKNMHILLICAMVLVKKKGYTTVIAFLAVECGAVTTSHFMNFRDTVLENAKQQIRSLEIKLDSANAQHLKEKEEWGLSLRNVEETWRSNTLCYLVK